VLEPADDEVVVFKEFFRGWASYATSTYPHQYSTQVPGTTSSVDPKHYRAIVEVFWVVLSFSGVPTSDDFAKWYKLHY
jgi:hypothetical protein